MPGKPATIGRSGDRRSNDSKKRDVSTDDKTRTSFKAIDPRPDTNKNGRLPPLTKANSTNQLLSKLTGRADNATPEGFIKRSSSEDCFKCMLKIPHTKCQQHKYIRIGGGYRHSYGMVKAMLEAIEIERQRQAIIQERLEAINESKMRCIKTYIRTKSGRLIERIVFMNEADYQAFQAGGDAAREILNKYLSKEEAKGLESWDKEEQKPITVYIRTKSGRRIAKLVYVTKEEYEKMKKGEINADDLMKKYVKLEDGEKLDGWGEAEMKAVKMFVRTKSGRLIEKTIMMSKEDFEELERIKKAGGDTSKLLNKYMSVNEGEKIEGWKETSNQPMKSVKVMVRTKSGRLVERTVLMTEEEYKQFEKSGCDLNFLKKFLPLGRDDQIEGWEKASTVYSADPELVKNAKAGQRIIGKNGQEYEVVIDPLTGKKYLKKIVKKGDPGLKKGKKKKVPTATLR